MRTRRSWRAAPLPLAVGLATLATVAATAGVAFAATTTTTTTPRPSFSTASGTVAALSTATSSMEVQSPSSGQVTVSWTTTTRFSETVTIAATKLVVGDCVTVVSASKNKTGPIAATTVSLRPSTNGSCSGAGGFGLAGAPPTGSGGFGGGSGARGFVGTAPGGSFPRRSGASRFGTGALGRFASGKVIEKSKSTFVVKGFAPGARPAAST
ncbi:MAG TPA: hypothetical protein VKX24_04350 [Acidimicrobiia bacterium]|nr:hypothetical protein [Acidimicrobiia bacterium]